MPQLTPKQENFAQLYVELGSASEAYRRAYESKAKPESVHVAASRLLNEPTVSLRIQEIRDRLAELSIWKRVDSIKTLAEIAQGGSEGSKDSDRVAAVKAINSMHGWDKQTIDHTSSDGSMSPQKTPREMTDEELARIADGEPE